MNKLGIACILLLTINVSSINNTYDELVSVVYDRLLLIIEGMTPGEQKKCYNGLKDNKDKFFYVLKDIFNCTSFWDFIQIIANFSKYGIDEDLEKDINSNCHIDEFSKYTSDFYDDVKRVERFQDIGNNIKNNAYDFQKGTTGFVRKRKIANKIKLIGKIISAILNIRLD